jgi:hypothetical protein
MDEGNLPQWPRIDQAAGPSQGRGDRLLSFWQSV